MPEQQNPSAPTISVSEDVVTINISGLDEDGIMLSNLENLYLNVKINGEDYIFSTESLGDVEELPYYYETPEYLIKNRGYNNGLLLGRFEFGYGLIELRTSSKIETVEATAIYYDEGSRKVATSSYESGVAKIISENDKATTIYDIFGRKTPNNISSPGIYICNGKKIML